MMSKLIDAIQQGQAYLKANNPSRLDSIVVALAEIHNQKPAAIFRQLIIWEEENAEV